MNSTENKQLILNLFEGPEWATRDPHTGHPGIPAGKMPSQRVIPARRHAHGVTPNLGMRDCVECGLPFFSRSTANVVCPVCRAESEAVF